MNDKTLTLIAGSASAAIGFVVGTLVQKKVREKKPEWESFTAYASGFLIGTGVTLLAKNAITTKSEAGAILAAD